MQFSGLTIATDLDELLSLYRVPKAFHEKLLREHNGRFSVGDTEASIFFGNKIQAADIGEYANLKWLHLGSIGFDKLDLDQLKANDIILTNSAGCLEETVAATVIGNIYSLLRMVVPATAPTGNQLARATYEPYFYDLDDDIGKRAVVFGYGRIGQLVFQKLAALGFDVSVVRHNSNQEVRGASSTLSLCEAKDNLGNFDVVVNLLPLRDTTKLFFDEKTFEKFKPRSIYINAGRGQTNQESALIAAIHSGVIKAAALDVFETEPLSEKSPLWKCPQITLTPHVAGMSPNYWKKQEELFFCNLRAFIGGDLDQMRNRLI